MNKLKNFGSQHKVHWSGKNVQPQSLKAGIGKVVLIDDPKNPRNIFKQLANSEEFKMPEGYNYRLSMSVIIRSCWSRLNWWYQSPYYQQLYPNLFKSVKAVARMVNIKKPGTYKKRKSLFSTRKSYKKFARK